MATINGTKFDDRITGTFLNDVINGLDGNDHLDGGSGHDQLNGGAGDDVMIGGRGLDTLTGGAGDDILEGGADADAMMGGIGDDIYVVDNVGDTVSEGKNEGLDRVYARISYALPSNIEVLVLDDVPGAINGTGNGLDNIIWGNSLDNTLTGGAGDDELAGHDAADTLIGGSGSDTLDGGDGNDSMVGGTGNDIYGIEDAGDTVLENPGEGIDEVYTALDYTLPANVENLWLSYGALNGTGNSLDNQIVGNSDINVIDGGAGNDTLYGNVGFGFEADTLIGGTGDDTFYVVGPGAIIVEHSNGGTDRIVSLFSYMLPWNVENLEFQPWVSDVDGTGNNLDNAISGSDGINVLSGQWGDDELFGHAGADTLVGGVGHDHHDGGAGADVMVGGTGDDTYVVDDAGDVVTELAGEGTDWVEAWITHVLAANVENLELRGDADIDATGNALDNLIMGNDGINVITGGAGNDSIGGEGGNDTILGGEGNDLLDGQRGADTMTGGVGDDTYFVNDAGDIVVENAGEGTDLAYCRATHTLAANVENLTLDRFSGAINGTGNSLVNAMTGNDDDNVLSGMAGDDMLVGGGGIDHLIGGAGNDTMEGGDGNDILDGGISNDTFIGGAGVDLLTVGNGVDRFQFNQANEGADVIADFVSGTDRIWLDDAGFGLAGTGTLAANGVAFVQGAAATSASATVLFDAATHQLLWDADGTGAGSAQLLATLVGVNQMSASDFMIV